MVSPAPISQLYEDHIRGESQRVAQTLRHASGTVGAAFGGDKLGQAYQERLMELVEPLGVPNLVDVIKVWDIIHWRLHSIVVDSGTIEGPLRSVMQTGVLMGLTDLDPLGLATETPVRVRHRVRRKIGPLSEHLKRYDLIQRVHLWVRHVVYGERMHDIATSFQDQGGGSPNADPLGWIKTRIQETHHLLGVKRRGRPRKGGVLRLWKLAAN